MSHSYHEALSGYDERNIWHDGCPECEERAAGGLAEVHALDPENTLRAWQLMRAIEWGGGEGADHNVSLCDLQLSKTLYDIAVFLERCGIRPDEVQARLEARLEVFG